MPASSHSPYWFLIVFGLVAAVFPLMPLLLAQLWFKFFAPGKPGPDKNAAYECGLAQEGDAWIQMKIHYYLYAIVFLIVDVEAVILFPFAVAYSGLGWEAVAATFGFVLMLTLGIVWAWGRGFLEWE
jgi:NADH:ubiquinone oxidoreductase subunit 3 (subunit A)